MELCTKEMFDYEENDQTVFRIAQMGRNVYGIAACILQCTRHDPC